MTAAEQIGVPFAVTGDKKHHNMHRAGRANGFLSRKLGALF